jgi:hypothetical protein
MPFTFCDVASLRLALDALHIGKGGPGSVSSFAPEFAKDVLNPLNELLYFYVEVTRSSYDFLHLPGPKSASRL